MLYLAGMTAVTFAALAGAYWLVLKSIRKKTKVKLALVIAGFLISASPVLYALYDEAVTVYEDANIGLGLAYMTTWSLTLLSALAGAVLRGRKRE
ncbi:hypothetical protein WKH31_15260 [Metabacillus indicus]|uniref:hypothetical protein n=1 Tax=Metabacillus indicus TaxID=246786 RepID=UPI00317A3DB1